MNSLTWAKLIRTCLRPEFAVRQIIRRFSIGSVDFRLSLQALDRPQYAFGVKQAIYLASKLKYPKVSVIEFGVASGGGLLALEKYAAEFGTRAGMVVEVYGFDLGQGLPAPLDYRDLGYVWKRGAYQMDVEGLKKRLKSAKLLLGDVRETVSEFLHSEHAPIGFISFDLDYYGSTTAALELFTGQDRTLLPRVICYFDDIVSDGHQLHCNRVGELLAIDEFNQQQNSGHTLAPFGIMNAGLMFPALWMEQLWVYHRFQHNDYNTYIGI
ncbi:MAG TPA: hypothetical protein VK776_07420 [Bryobacteraceae bacterium]|jgi:hypothetical protein|nr:hypothetical protein [Bryobacteraceae bacterium]